MKESKIIREAIRLLDSGIPKSQVCRRTGIDKKTLNIYWSRYKTEGEGAFNAKQYSPETKREIIQKHLEKGLSISLLSQDYGIPDITIRRWIKRFRKDGEDGLNPQGQEAEEDQYWDLTNRALRITSDTFRVFGKTSIIKRIPDMLNERGAFASPEFGGFLVTICRLIVRDQAEPTIAYNTARLILMTIPYKGTMRNEAEELLAMQETKMFVQQFIDTVGILNSAPNIKKE